MLERQLHRVENLVLDMREAPDIVPCDIRDLGRTDTLAVPRTHSCERVVQISRRHDRARCDKIARAGGTEALYRREARTVDHVAQVVGQQRGRLHSERMHIDIRARLARLERHTQQLRPRRLRRRTQLDRLGKQRTQRGRTRLSIVHGADHQRHTAVVTQAPMQHLDHSLLRRFARAATHEQIDIPQQENARHARAHALTPRTQRALRMGIRIAHQHRARQLQHMHTHALSGPANKHALPYAAGALEQQVQVDAERLRTRR